MATQHTSDLTPTPAAHEQIARLCIESLERDLRGSVDSDGYPRRDSCLVILGELLSIVAYLATLPQGDERIARLQQFMGRL